jgi:UDP-N-acetylmuramyl pentapeptide phosphotransferase/UDP-N-acetylglucosamine-1-phosphate transferase
MKINFARTVRRAQGACSMVILIAIIGAVFTVWKTSEPFQTISQFMIWICAGGAAVIGCVDDTTPESVGEINSRRKRR